MVPSYGISLSGSFQVGLRAEAGVIQVVRCDEKLDI